MKGNTKTALVTGGAGFVGSSLCETLLDDGYEVYAVDNFITGRRENLADLSRNKKFHFRELDINTPAFLEEFRLSSLAEIYHLACPTGVPNIKTLGEEMLLTCSLGTRNALEVAKVAGAKILFSSSCEVYGEPEVSPQYEHYTGNVSSTGPRSAYEEGKRFSESLFILYHRKYQVDTRIVRIFNTYGPRMSLSDQRVIPRFLRSMTLGQKLTLYGDGEQIRTHLFVADLIRGLRLVMADGITGEVYNVGGTRQVTIRELAELLMALADYELGVEFLPHFIEDHSYRLPAVEKLEALGWRPEVSLEEGLRRMLLHHGLSREVVPVADLAFDEAA